MTDRLGPPDTGKFPELQDASYVQLLPAGTPVSRIHFTAGQFPSVWNSFRWFGPTVHRFDHHLLPKRIHHDRAIMYGSVPVADRRGNIVSALDVCLMEVFGATGVIDRERNSPYFATFRLARPLTLLDLVDSRWITKAGGNAAICSGPHAAARDWSRAIHSHYKPELLDGLYYECSTLPVGRSLALYERAVDALPDRPALSMPLTHPGMRSFLDEASERLGLIVV